MEAAVQRIWPAPHKRCAPAYDFSGFGRYGRARTRQKKHRPDGGDFFFGYLGNENARGQQSLPHLACAFEFEEKTKPLMVAV